MYSSEKFFFQKIHILGKSTTTRHMKMLQFVNFSIILFIEKLYSRTSDTYLLHTRSPEIGGGNDKWLEPQKIL